MVKIKISKDTKIGVPRKERVPPSRARWLHGHQQARKRVTVSQIRVQHNNFNNSYTHPHTTYISHPIHCFLKSSSSYHEYAFQMLSTTIHSLYSYPIQITTLPLPPPPPWPSMISTATHPQTHKQTTKTHRPCKYCKYTSNIL